MKLPFILQPVHDGHSVYIRKRYICTDRSCPHFEKRVYESVNSLGFTEPFIYMPTDDKAIIAIYRVRIYVEGIDDVNDGYRPQNQRSSTVFKPSQTATQEACNG